jgi:integrating conjugative element membrane protein (TIGR03747 family)
MGETTNSSHRQQARQQGLIASLIALPFRLFGFLCGSLLLSILIELIGLHIAWSDQGWHHAEEMLSHELDQLSETFKQSILVSEPAHTTQQLLSRTYDTLFVRTGALHWIHQQSERTNPSTRSAVGINKAMYLGHLHGETYALATLYTLMTFLVRLMVLALTLPLFLIAAFVGLVDGFVRRDVRRFGAGHESGFLYHRAKASLMPLALLPSVLYLAVPVSVHPLVVLLPSAVLLSLAVNITAGSFKKYL